MSFRVWYFDTFVEIYVSKFSKADLRYVLLNRAPFGVIINNKLVTRFGVRTLQSKHT